MKNLPMFRHYVSLCFFCTPCNAGIPIAKAIYASIEVKKVVTNSKISKMQGVTRQKKSNGIKSVFA